MGKVRAPQDGELILMAYTHFKVRHDPGNAVVQKGLAAAKKIVGQASGGNKAHKYNYDAAVAVLLLASVDANAYQSELRTLQQYLFDAQAAHGGWTYPGEHDGDVSQTQYALLAIWTLDRVGIKLDYRKVAAAAEFLLRVQDEQGPWPYHAKIPTGNTLIRQPKTGYSMAIAGGSSTLIAGDALRLWGETVDDADPGIVGLPKAVKLYKEDKNVQQRKRASLSKWPILNACQRMEAWRAKNPYKRSTARDWFYYQLYTLERYESFIETANGRPKDKSPAWYNNGVDELRKYQGADGGWADNSHSRGPVATSFAILFLIRSTQRAIFSMGEGVARGGKGFGKDVRNAKLVGGQVKTEAIRTEVNDLLNILEGDSDSLAGKSLPDDLQLAEPGVDRDAQLDRLERLVRGSNSWQARRVAARLLGKSDEMRSRSGIDLCFERSRRTGQTLCTRWIALHQPQV